MQILRQQMDLDQRNENAHHPLKPQSNHATKSVLNKKRVNRAFGQDLTNQHRQMSNQMKVPQRSNNSDGFSFVKKPIMIETQPQSKACSKTSHISPQTPPQSPQIAATDCIQQIQRMDEDNLDNIDANISVDKQELAPWDIADIDNDLCVTDYVKDIFCGFRSDEALHRGIIENEADFMDFQKDVNARMRVVLVDWLIEVHRKFKLVPSTYFLSINLLDRYLSKKQLHRRKLQLCGCTCLWIASKYHEIFAPEMEDFVYISDNAFDAEDLIKMEIDVLKTLSFTLTVPTVLNYGERYSKISSYYLKKDREIKIISDLIMYCIEHCVMSYTLCRKLPSLIGASCFVYACISTKVFSLETFETDEIDKAIGYTFDELMPAMIEIDHIVRTAKKGKHKAVYKKYCNTKYSNIGKLNFDKLNTSFLRQKESPESA